MNITVAILEGLILLLPGMTTLVAWNLLGASQDAKRPELQLTSVTALFLALCASVIFHIFGYALVSLIWASASEIGDLMAGKATLPPLIHNPYDRLINFGMGGDKPTGITLEAFLLVILMESLLAWRLVASEGLELVMERFDVRQQGWVFQHIVRPSRHGYKPIGYVLTNPAQGEYGIGYEGVIADVRQGENGELKAISLAEPQRFVFRLHPCDAARPRREPSLEITDRIWVGGVVALEAAAIRNIVVHSVAADLITEVEEQAPTESDGTP